MNQQNSAKLDRAAYETNYRPIQSMKPDEKLSGKESAASVAFPVDVAGAAAGSGGGIDGEMDRYLQQPTCCRWLWLAAMMVPQRPKERGGPWRIGPGRREKVGAAAAVGGGGAHLFQSRVDILRMGKKDKKRAGPAGRRRRADRGPLAANWPIGNVLNMKMKKGAKKNTTERKWNASLSILRVTTGPHSQCQPAARFWIIFGLEAMAEKSERGTKKEAKPLLLCIETTGRADKARKKQQKKEIRRTF